MLFGRRQTLGLLAAATARPAFAQSSAPAVSRATAYAFTFQGLNSGEIRLGDHAGKPILIVNTASFCGFTPQYVTLQQLWTRYRDRGLMVLGVPSNDFGEQEPGTPREIAEVAKGLGVSFPLAAKAHVVGAEAHPFFKWAATEHPANPPTWNFHKYLVGRDGHIANVFATTVEPNDPRVIQAIVKELPGVG